MSQMSHSTEAGHYLPHLDTNLFLTPIISHLTSLNNTKKPARTQDRQNKTILSH